MGYTVGAQKKELILSEAKKLFWEKGLQNTSVNDIARAAKIRQSLIYYYYRDKNEIAREIYNDSCIEMETLFQEEVKKNGAELGELMYRGLFVAANMRVNLTCTPYARLMIDVNDGSIQLRSSFVRGCYRRFIKECPLGPRAVSLDLVMIQNIGLNSLLIQMYTDKDLLFTADTLIRYKLQILFESIKISEEETARLIKEIMKMEPQYTFSVGEGFSISIGPKISMY